MTSISNPRPGASSATPQRAVCRDCGEPWVDHAAAPGGEEPVCQVGPDDHADDPLSQCQGCGTWRGIAWLGKPHACHRNDDGTYEEGGTFQ